MWWMMIMMWMLSMHGKIIAGMLFFLFFLPPLLSPLTPILSLLSLPPFPLPHLLFLSNFNPLQCSSSPARRFSGYARQVHRAVSTRRPPRAWHVRQSPTQALLQDILQNGSVLVLLLCSGIPPSPLPLLSPSSPPPLPLLISLFILFFFPSLILLTFISDPCLVVQHSTRTTACSLRTAHSDSAAQHPCAPPMTAVSPSAVEYMCDWACRANTPPCVGMIPSPFIFSFSLFFFGFYVLMIVF